MHLYSSFQLYASDHTFSLQTPSPTEDPVTPFKPTFSDIRSYMACQTSLGYALAMPSKGPVAGNSTKFPLFICIVASRMLGRARACWPPCLSHWPAMARPSEDNT